MTLRSKWFMFLSIVMTVVLLAACSDNGEDESAPAEDDAAQTEEGQDESEDGEEEESQEPANSLSSDEELQTQLEAEDGVESAMVQIVDGEQSAVNVDIEIAADQDPEEAFETYGAMIKETYPERTVDLIIVQEGQIAKQDQL